MSASPDMAGWRGWASTYPCPYCHKNKIPVYAECCQDCHSAPCPNADGIPTCGPAVDCAHLEFGAGSPRPTWSKA